MVSGRAARRLIVNADDFGLSAGVNRGILVAHERGIVTSASLMVRQPAATEAAIRAREFPCLGVGLHLDLGEWVYRDGTWVTRYEVVPLDAADRIRGEVLRQLDAFRTLMGREPTHLDSHQHVHRDEPARSAIAAVAEDLGVPRRHYARAVQHCGAFYGQARTGEPMTDAIGSDALIRLLRALPAGVTELACHPGFAVDVDGAYRAERDAEVVVLCDPRIRDVLVEEHIDLCSFADMQTA